VLGDYERISYCLYQSNNGTETETLQLIVGRSTIQICHQIQDNSKNKNSLPNKGEPFLEYIWTKHIPINQEREKTRLRIKDFKCRLNGDKLADFRLEVYWYIRVENNKENVKKEEYDIIEENNEIWMKKE